MKNILVTGASGFLGRHLVPKLKSLGYTVFESNTKTGNLLEYSNLFIFNDTQFDYIFHLAAHTKAGDYCLYHKGEQFEINQLLNTNILKYWREYQPQVKMIGMGTSCAYDPSLINKTEEAYLTGDADKDLFTYAMTKRMLLVGMQAYAAQYDMKYMYYIPSTLYGENFDVNDSHFIFDLIKKIYNGKYNNEEVTLWGDGNQKRELIYIHDAINIMVETMNLDNTVLNISSDHEKTIKSYAQYICSILDFDSSKIVYDPTKFVGVTSKLLSNKKIRKLIPNSNYTPFYTGLQNTINYYHEKISTNIR